MSLEEMNLHVLLIFLSEMNINEQTLAMDSKSDPVRVKMPFPEINLNFTGLLSGQYGLCFSFLAPSFICALGMYVVSILFRGLELIH